VPVDSRAASARRSGLTTRHWFCALLACLLAPAPALAILDGTPAEEESAVATSTVAIVIADTSRRGPNGKPGYFPSSGVVIARDWILTVKHAFAAHLESQYVWRVRFDRQIADNVAEGRDHVLARGDVVFHPALDLALVRIPSGMPFEYRPIPMVTDARRLKPDIPFRVVLAGFGPAQNKAGRNILRFVEEPVSAMTLRPGGRWPAELVPPGQGSYYFEIDQHDGRGSCSGDSGGPVFARLSDDALALLGVIKGNASYSAGHPCLGWSYAIRVDRALTWITQVTGRLYDPESMSLLEVR
jgi:hypothetical protein